MLEFHNKRLQGWLAWLGAHQTAVIALLFVLALAARLGVYVVAGDLFSLELGEIQGIQELDIYARNLLETGTFGLAPGVPDAVLSPVYIYSLAGLYGLFGHHVLTVVVSQALMGALTVVLVILIGRRAFNLPVGVLAGLFTALYPYLAYQDLAVMETALYMLALTLGIWGVQRYPATHDLKSLIIGGLGLGLATLTRNETGLFVAAATAWLFFTEGFTWRPLAINWRHLAVSLLPLLMVVLVFAPWIARNYSVFGELVLSSTKGGGNFYQGNNPKTIEYMLSGIEVQYLGESCDDTEVECQDLAYQASINYLRDNWQQVPYLYLVKLITHWRPDIFPWAPPPDESLIYGETDVALQYAVNATYQTYRQIHLLYFGPLWVLGLIGLAANFRRTKGAVLLTLLLVAMTAVYVFFHGGTRWRLPTDPLFFVFSAAAGISLISWLDRRLSKSTRLPG